MYNRYSVSVRYEFMLGKIGGNVHIYIHNCYLVNVVSVS